MKKMLASLGPVWRISLPYFRSREMKFAILVLGLVIGLRLFNVWLDVQFNDWNNTFYTALQKKDWSTFAYAMFVTFTWIAALSIITSVYQIWFSQWLQIRWRNWMTHHYLEKWMARGTHYRMRLAGNPADNPDQRVAEDTDRFTDGTLSIGVALLGQIVTLFTFLFILWNLSSSAPLVLFGQNYAIPGYLVWLALGYAVIGTWLTHLVGRPLVSLNFMQQRYEADFRFSLVRLRENAEQVALLKGEGIEREGLYGRFGNVLSNFYQIMSRTKKLTFLTAGYSQLAVIFPFIFVSPLYFSGKIELGALTQIAGAFGTVQGALSFFISAYSTLATWKSVVDRLDGFEKSIDAAEAQEAAGPKLESAGTTAAMSVRDLVVKLPDGREIVQVPSFSLAAGERVLVNGPSGSGKTSLFRSLGGIWPYGSGTVDVPRDEDVLVLPQEPYMPLGSLKTALAYPNEASTLDDGEAKRLLSAVGLDWLAAHLDEDAPWGNRLSGGEQQRIALARTLIAKPKWLLLDEATSAVDENVEASLYGLLKQELPGTAILSIGHRSSLTALHDRVLNLIPSKEGSHTLVEAAAS